MASPLPICRLHDLGLCLNEGVEWTHAILLLWAAFYAGEWGDAVVDDDAYLRLGFGRA